MWKNSYRSYPGFCQGRQFVISTRFRKSSNRMIHVKFSPDLDLAKLCGCLVCEPIKSVRGLEKDFWNFMVCRPQYALTLNSWASYAKRLVAERNVQEAKDHIGIDISNLKQIMPDN